MMHIKIIAVGRLKEEYLRAAQLEYVKRLTPFCKIQITEIAEARIGGKPSRAEIKSALKKEASSILKEIPSDSFVFSMCVEGRAFSSVEFSEKIDRAAIAGISNMVFIIGSSFGLDEEIKQQSSQQISFSSMTFPHQLMRIMLLEQIYRAFSILNHTKYHK